jgi:hypothetical protein
MGASSEFTDYDEYRKNGKTARVDAYNNLPYKESLVRAARELELIK